MSVQLGSLLPSLVVALSSLLPPTLHILAAHCPIFVWSNCKVDIDFDPTFNLVCTVGFAPYLPGWSLPFPIVLQHWTTLMSHLHVMQRVRPIVCSKFKVKTFMLPGNAGFTKKAHFLNCRFEKPDTTVHGHLAVEGHERLYPVSQNGNSVSALFWDNLYLFLCGNFSQNTGKINTSKHIVIISRLFKCFCTVFGRWIFIVWMIASCLIRCLLGGHVKEKVTPIGIFCPQWSVWHKNLASQTLPKT